MFLGYKSIESKFFYLKGTILIRFHMVKSNTLVQFIKKKKGNFLSRFNTLTVCVTLTNKNSAQALLIIVTFCAFSYIYVTRKL